MTGLFFTAPYPLFTLNTSNLRIIELRNRDMNNLILETQPNHRLPTEYGFLRLNQILKLIPVGKTTWWNGVKSGRFPKPVKLGERITAWRAEDIRNCINNFS